MSISEHSANPLAAAPIGSTLTKFAVPAIISNLLHLYITLSIGFLLGRTLGFLLMRLRMQLFRYPLSVLPLQYCLSLGAARLNLEMRRETVRKEPELSGLRSLAC